ncbi:hypothetical protein SERLA73DRAFT_69536 [Serpula lacrymans var. lacrymans S7.3]|uniref:Uncharacterized protein n=2 Tax=Serpula lacrymans var. lacrymans TaxID=341189 RepID=F8PIR1_SERL3|nr:uncharacterized protein SERLADRAFT_433537 [Serpula lacrymans var. lacrymans S7.9]EGO03694.1 hypothetical protein SERLA73DRAFT_69536 [Serpula lacrymans var. lacrymans S7.3]EGO29557.1 hypothetical protein SERLADRAFT_433537 [Serpula lacrymans var. lacrymans S7.9]
MSQSQPRPESRPQLSSTHNAGPPSNAIHKGADLIVALIQDERQRISEDSRRAYAELERRHIELRNQSNYTFEQSGRRKAELEAEVQRLNGDAVNAAQTARQALSERGEALRISTQAKNDLVQLAQVLDQFGIIARSGAHDSFDVTLDDRWSSLLREGRKQDEIGESKGVESSTDGKLGIVKEEDFGPPPSSQTAPLGFLQELKRNIERDQKTIGALREEISLLQEEKGTIKIVTDRAIEEANAVVQLRDTEVKELQAQLTASREEIERLKSMPPPKPTTTQREVQTMSTPTTQKPQLSMTSLSAMSISRAEKHKEADIQGVTPTTHLNKELAPPTLKIGKKLAVKTSSLKRPNKDADDIKASKKARTSLDSKSTPSSLSISSKADDDSRPKGNNQTNISLSRRGGKGTYQIFTPQTSPSPEPQPQPGSGVNYDGDSQTTETSGNQTKPGSSSTTSPEDALVVFPFRKHLRESDFVKPRLISNPQSISERSDKKAESSSSKSQAGADSGKVSNSPSVKSTGTSSDKLQASSKSVNKTPTSLPNGAPTSLLSKIKFTKSNMGKG